MKILLAGLAFAVGLLVVGAIATLIIARDVEARYPPLGRFVPVGLGRMHYMEASPRSGAQEGVIVLLHGASGSSADPMLTMGQRLAEHYRVIAIDRPGHGWSDRLGGPEVASPARQAVLIREVLAKLGIDRAIVVGHSWSGALVANLALDHADLVSGLVLLSPVSHPWPGGSISWYYKPAVSGFVGWLFTRILTTPLGSLLIRPGLASVFAPQAPPPNYVDDAQIPLVLRPKTFQANAEDVGGLYDFVSLQSVRYRDITAPTVIIAGDADSIVRTDIHARSLGHEIPGAKLVVLPNVGHMPHHAAPDLVIAEIEGLATRAAAAVH